MYWQDKINFLGRLLIQTECIKNTWPQQQSILLLTYITFHTEEATLTNCRRYVQALADDNLLRFFPLSWIETILRKECLLWKNNVFFSVCQKSTLFFVVITSIPLRAIEMILLWKWQLITKIHFGFTSDERVLKKKTNLSVAMDLRLFNNVLKILSVLLKLKFYVKLLYIVIILFIGDIEYCFYFSIVQCSLVRSVSLIN